MKIYTTILKYQDFHQKMMSKSAMEICEQQKLLQCFVGYILLVVECVCIAGFISVKAGYQGMERGCTSFHRGNFVL